MSFDPFASPLPGNRCVIDGIVYGLSAIEIVASTNPAVVGTRELGVRCTRCKSHWSMTIGPEELRRIYERIPPRSSPLRLIHGSAVVKQHVIAWTSGHVCMPPGFASIPNEVLSSVDRDATRIEQLDALASAIAQLAIDEGM